MGVGVVLDGASGLKTLTSKNVGFLFRQPGIIEQKPRLGIQKFFLWISWTWPDLGTLKSGHAQLGHAMEKVNRCTGFAEVNVAYTS